ncbi:hypothetical protein NDU88_003803 [Pleurodeles waltl]|uniref:Uncharacterized protein n=1 Tax=Pleurodeles waltl TaxID=8319 RepID=A0AAV7UZI0_PLEWA|nr:hypothetical protein NDU88_003803 [Pleurodeles waltl]
MAPCGYSGEAAHRMGEQLDRQTTRLDGTEERISGLEDGAATMVKHLDKLERISKTVAIKNEDLEAHSHCNPSSQTSLTVTILHQPS